MYSSFEAFIINSNIGNCLCVCESCGRTYFYMMSRNIRITQTHTYTYIQAVSVTTGTQIFGEEFNERNSLYRPVLTVLLHSINVEFINVLAQGDKLHNIVWIN